MEEKYLAKWLNNELSKEELEAFKKTPGYPSYERIVRMASAAEAPEFDVEKALADLQSRKVSRDTPVVRLNPWKKALRIAAVLVLIFGLSMVYLNTRDENISTEYAQRAEVVLPDASEIILNAASEITYDMKNWDRERLVKLSGEAFFKVAKGQTFTVATDAGEVTVLGTQFNVENRNGYFEVSCYEGLVSVGYAGEVRKLPAGNSFLAINGKIVAAKGPNTDVPSWMNDESSFQSTPLSYVLDEFERQYDVTVSTQNIDLDQLYTGSFSNTNMELALQSISTPSQISFKLDGNKVLFYAGETP